MPATRPHLSNQARLTRSLPWLVLTGTIIVWLWPITLAGRMPIGGDVTSFFLPIMAYYRQALIDGRVPLWNELWGFGFPMLAESQAGVFYPPHLILFRLFETETAYSVNIVLHYLMAGWFAYFCGREFGLGRWGATLTGLVFAGNGFFIIHFPHQWSYTTGCWMPLAVGLAWRAMRVEGGRVERERVEGGSVEDATGQVAGRPATGRRVRAALGLALVLAVQMLAGHFQLAFYTQVVVLMMGLICTVQRVWCRLVSTRRKPPPHGAAKTGSVVNPQHSTQYSVPSTQPAGVQRGTSKYAAGDAAEVANTSRSRSPGAPAQKPQSAIRKSPVRPWGTTASVLWVAVPVAFAFGLAAVQILPTYELIRIALPEGRDFEYLSGFANTPFHLVSYLLPTLFHVNPLWRPVAWDPLHTSPEECFSYVGLLPLCLALGAAWRWRREPRVRLWILLVMVTLLFSLGPYVPGFKLLIRLPGFSGFRAASRWSLTTALFLALLAGFGLDQIRSTARLRSWAWRFGVATALVATCCLAFMFLVFNGTKSGGASFMKSLDAAWRLVSPWANDDGLANVVAQAQKGQHAPDLFSLGYRLTPGPGDTVGQTWFGPIRELSLQGERRHIAIQELLPPLIVICLIVVVVQVVLVQVGRRQPPLAWIIVGLTAFELSASNWLRPADFVPRGKLTEISPVLNMLASKSQGQRVLAFLMPNQAMMAGAGSVSAYRTVDLLGPSTFDFNGQNWTRQEKEATLARQAVRWTVYPGGAVKWTRSPLEDYETETVLTDPILARIIDGPGWARLFPQATQRVVVRGHTPPDASRAWLFDAKQIEAETESARGQQRLDEAGRRKALEAALLPLRAEPAKQLSFEPEREEFEFETDGHRLVIMWEQAFPGWEAILSTDGVSRRGAVETIGPGLRAVRVEGPGKYRLELRYRSHPFELGCKLSLAALVAWAAAATATFVRRRAAAVVTP